MAECAVPQMLGSKVIRPSDLVLVAGAEGIIGGRLFYELLKAEFNVRCLLRMEDEGRIDRKPGVEFFYCDPWSGDIPDAAFEGVKYVVNAASPLNTGSIPLDSVESFERLANTLITRSAMKKMARYAGLSSVFLAESEDGGWAYSNYRMELSARNSGASYTILRTGLIVDESNSAVLRRLGSRGARSSIFGKKAAGKLYVSTSALIAEAFARVLRTDQAINRTYEVLLGRQLTRKEAGRLAASGSDGKGYWEAEEQMHLSSGRYGGAVQTAEDLEISTHEFEPPLMQTMHV
ncbi:MAG: NAD(P)H-binding protein [Thermoplasmata archaeon]|nr:NAD(P)H-binding protein [Candidatus Sysuiplasma jiujiangense]